MWTEPSPNVTLQSGYYEFAQFVDPPSDVDNPHRVKIHVQNNTITILARAKGDVEHLTLIRVNDGSPMSWFVILRNGVLRYVELLRPDESPEKIVNIEEPWNPKFCHHIGFKVDDDYDAKTGIGTAISSSGGVLVSVLGESAPTRPLNVRTSRITSRL